MVIQIGVFVFDKQHAFESLGLSWKENWWSKETFKTYNKSRSWRIVFPRGKLRHLKKIFCLMFDFWMDCYECLKSFYLSQYMHLKSSDNKTFTILVFYFNKISLSYRVVYLTEFMMKWVCFAVNEDLIPVIWVWIGTPSRLNNVI